MALLELKKSDKQAKSVEAGKPSKKPKKAAPDKPFVPSLPTVNLLSPEIQEVVELQRLRRLFAVLAVVVVVGMVAAWVLQTGLIAVAQRSLNKETDRGTQLRTELNALNPVKLYYGQIDANQTTIQTTMANEVLNSAIIRELDAVTPIGIQMSTIALSVNTGAPATPGAAATPVVASCPSPDPFSGTAASSAGCITVDGIASSRIMLGQWIRQIQKVDLFTEVFVPTTVSDEGGNVTFSASVGLDAAHAYTRRYDNLDFLKGGAN